MPGTQPTGAQRKGLRAIGFDEGSKRLAPEGARPVSDSKPPRQVDDVHRTHEYARGSASDIRAVVATEWQPLEAETHGALLAYADTTRAFHSEVHAFVRGEGEQIVSFLQKEAEGSSMPLAVLSAITAVGGAAGAGLKLPKAAAVVVELVKQGGALAAGHAEVGPGSVKRAGTAYSRLTTSVPAVTEAHDFSLALMGAHGAERLGRIAGSIDGLLSGDASSLVQLEGRLSKGSAARFDADRTSGVSVGADRLEDLGANADEIALDADRIATALMNGIADYRVALADFRSTISRALAGARKSLDQIKDAHLRFVAADRGGNLQASVRLTQGRSAGLHFYGCGLAPNDLLSPQMRARAEGSSDAELGKRGFGVDVGGLSPLEPALRIERIGRDRPDPGPAGARGEQAPPRHARGRTRHRAWRRGDADASHRRSRP